MSFLPDWDLPHALTVYGVLKAARWVGVVPSWVPRKVESGLGWVCAVGGCFWYAMYHWTSRVIMHKQAPVVGRYTYTMFFLLRPLQAVFRLITSPLRVVPDVVIIGEVRCGTTTMAKYLNKFPGCRTPFCPWRVGFADDKESFYLVGHYMGVVHPMLYRMVFPTIFEKWYCAAVGKPFFTYDACAQYATAPWVASSLKAANPNMKIIHCIREPISQNVSWFHFESQRDSTFTTLGLVGPYLPGRAPNSTLEQGWASSTSSETTKLFSQSENFDAPSWLPPLYLTWPKGQTSAYTQMGSYVKNLNRYAKYFPKNHIAVCNLSDLKTELGIRETLHSLNEMLPTNCHAPDDDITRWSQETVIHSNANATKPPPQDPATLAEMKAYYEPLNRELEVYLGKKLGW